LEFFWKPTLLSSKILGKILLSKIWYVKAE